jgi:hypothetical protein
MRDKHYRERILNTPLSIGFQGILKLDRGLRKTDWMSGSNLIRS